MRVVSCNASSSATRCSLDMGGECMARSTSARRTASGVLSSWLASAVNRRNAPKDVSRRAIMAFSVAPRRASSSPVVSTGNRRCRLRPSVIASTSLIIRPTGSTARPAMTYALATDAAMMSGATMSSVSMNSASQPAFKSTTRPATTRSTAVVRSLDRSETSRTSPPLVAIGYADVPAGTSCAFCVRRS